MQTQITAVKRPPSLVYDLSESTCSTSSFITTSAPPFSLPADAARDFHELNPNEPHTVQLRVRGYDWSRPMRLELTAGLSRGADRSCVFCRV